MLRKFQKNIYRCLKNNKHIYLFNINMAFDKYDNTFDFLNNNKHIKGLFIIKTQ